MEARCLAIKGHLLERLLGNDFSYFFSSTQVILFLSIDLHKLLLTFQSRAAAKVQ